MIDPASQHTQGDCATGEDSPLSRVQTDMFCNNCGASLHNHPVWRTDDAGLLAVRCERCRTISSANEALPYRRVWRQRLGTALMIVWMALLAGLLAIIIAIAFAIQIETPRHRWVNPSRAGQPRHSRTGRDRTLDWAGTKKELVWAVPASLLVAFCGGCLLACVVYHWRLRWHVLAAVAVPAVAALFSWLEHSGTWYRTWRGSGGMQVIYGIMALQMLGGILGAALGRPVARGVIRVLLPNRSRRFFAFLWRRDRKEMPLGPF